MGVMVCFQFGIPLTMIILVSGWAQAFISVWYILKLGSLGHTVGICLLNTVPIFQGGYYDFTVPVTL